MTQQQTPPGQPKKQPTPTPLGVIHPVKKHEVVILDVQGKAIYRNADKKVLVLKKNDRLFPGEAVRCEIGKVRLSLYGKIVTVIPTKSRTWIQIPTHQSDPVNPFDIGGATRTEFAIYSPCQSGVVSPSRLVLRWNPRNGEHSAVATVIYRGEEIITNFSLPWDQKTFVPKSIRQELAKLQDQGADDPIILSVQIQGNPKRSREEVRFRILSKAAEAELSILLRKANGETDAMFATARRAVAFVRFSLWSDAAEEYWSLYTLAPNRYDIAEVTRRVLLRVGDSVRAGKVKAR